MNAAPKEREEGVSARLCCAALMVLCIGGMALPCAYGAAVYSQKWVIQPQSYMIGAKKQDLFFTLPEKPSLGLQGLAWIDSSDTGPTCWQPITEFAQSGGCNITGIQDRNIGPANNIETDINCFGGDYTVGYTDATMKDAKCFISAIDIISATLNAAQNAANEQREQYYNTVIAPAIAGTTGGIAAVLAGVSGAFFCCSRKRRAPEDNHMPLLEDPVNP